jgi:serine protease Do
MLRIKRRHLTVGTLVTVGVGVLGAAGLAQHATTTQARPFSVAPSSQSSTRHLGTADGSLAPLEDLSNAFATIAARVKPSVVYITVREKSPRFARGDTGRAFGLPRALPPEFREFLRDLPIVPDEPRDVFAAGSGFIVSADGYILTNAHVVDDAEHVTVRLLDRREFTAKVVGRDPTTDVAVVKIDASGLTPAQLGNSDAARVGEWVLAIGNPLGEQLTFTVTQGIISAKGRGALSLPNSSNRSIQDFIQTDAAINPGNSGGPLVNVRGEVIGINAAIASPTGFNAGYGFAVPIDLARAVMDQLIKTGHVERAALGITVRDASPNDASYAGLPKIGGVVVEDYASADSPAKRAGIQPGDIIISVDGKPVEYAAQLQEAIAFRKPGDVVSVEVARKGGTRVTTKVTLRRADTGRVASADSDENEAPNGGDSGGVKVSALGIAGVSTDNSSVSGFELPSDVRGVVVLRVDDGSPAAGHLLTPATGGPDVILSVEGTAMRTTEDLQNALSHYRSGDIVTLRVYNARSGKRIERVQLRNSERR